jgi:hypothetical protein
MVLPAKKVSKKKKHKLQKVDSVACENIKYQKKNFLQMCSMNNGHNMPVQLVFLAWNAGGPFSVEKVRVFSTFFGKNVARPRKIKLKNF